MHFQEQCRVPSSRNLRYRQQHLQSCAVWAQICAFSFNSINGFVPWCIEDPTESWVARLQCVPSKVPTRKKNVHLRQHIRIWDVQSAHQDFKQFLKISNRIDGGIHVFDVNKDELVWGVTGKFVDTQKDIYAKGLTSDGFGRVLVSDRANRCIQMFAVADGRYLGSMLKEGEQGLGTLMWIRWCEKMSSLIVSHGKGDERFISVIKTLA